MKPTAFSQIAEQFIRVFLIIGAAVWISVSTVSYYAIGQAAVIASMAGMLAAIIILTMFLFGTGRRQHVKHGLPGVIIQACS